MNETYDKVFTSPINTSNSKQLYSFARARRFRDTSHPNCEQFYDIKGSLTDRAPSFGYGDKVSMADRDKAPPPNRYEIKSGFQRDQDHHRGWSFGSDQKKGIINDKDGKTKPGPGAYDANNRNNYVNLSYTMGCRTADSTSKHRNKLGPGQYNTIGMSNTGDYFYSKFKNSQCGKIGQSKRFSESKREDVPGPATYRGTDPMDLNKEGKYFPSKFKSSGVRSFSRSQRRGFQNTEAIPGPGSYFRFSEFGRRNKSSLQI